MAAKSCIVEQELTRAVNDAIAAGSRRACQRLAVFVCECGTPSCVDGCELSLDEFDRVRAQPGARLVAPRHAASTA